MEIVCVARTKRKDTPLGFNISLEYGTLSFLSIVSKIAKKEPYFWIEINVLDKINEGKRRKNEFLKERHYGFNMETDSRLSISLQVISH
ncbi:unnamed protein product [Larinioides sclopetarius]|uniref:Uncharacterized protein n=1 Tax=Larinioides sclopetarius TaxID=280406 RepID=A0AAV2B9D7_9ARAC